MDRADHTLKIIKNLDIKIFKEVYKPSNDTYLLLSLIKLDGDEEVLEIGSGTGIISLHCSSKGCDVLAIDNDERALKNTKVNAKRNNMDISVEKSYLFSSIAKNDWDVIIFNPPYLPEKEDLPKDNRWDGGEKGDEIILKFLKRADGFLSENGELYFCYSSLSREGKIKDIIERRYEGIDKQKDEFFCETLYGMRLRKK